MARRPSGSADLQRPRSHPASPRSSSCEGKRIRPDAETLRPVAGVPRKTPVCVPVARQWRSTRSSSAMAKSILTLRSVDPIGHSTANAFQPSGPRSPPCQDGAWSFQEELLGIATEHELARPRAPPIPNHHRRRPSSRTVSAGSSAGDRPRTCMPTLCGTPSVRSWLSSSFSPG